MGEDVGLYVRFFITCSQQTNFKKLFSFLKKAKLNLSFIDENMPRPGTEPGTFRSSV